MRKCKKIISALLILCVTLALSPGVAGAAADNTFFYHTLNAAEREVYDLFLSNMASIRAGTDITCRKTGVSESQLAAYPDTAFNAWSALTSDHPEIFWTYELSTGYSYSISGSGTLYFTLSCGINWTNGTGGGRSIQEDERDTQAKVSELVTLAQKSGNTVYAQLLAVHDWLTTNNCYNSRAAASGSYADAMPWTPLSALDTSLSPVCEGYARAFKLVCDKLGVPCILVSGDNHMWNHVQMDDGNWYLVDVTYDDPTVRGIGRLNSGYETHEFFLTSPDREHQPDRDIYPALSTRAYDPRNAAEISDPEPAVVFTDVPDGKYFTLPVGWAVERGVTAGISDTAFGPNEKCYVEQILTFIWNAYGKPEPAIANPFSDVGAKDYYRVPVTWAAEKEMLTGDTFGAQRVCTRGMAMYYLWIAAGRPEAELTDKFTDVPASSYYAQAVAWAYSRGITNGTGDSTFSPDDQCIRAQIVTFLYNAVAK